MYYADDALKDIKFLSPDYGSSGEQHKAYARVLDYISKQRFNEQIPELLRSKEQWQEPVSKKSDTTTQDVESTLSKFF